MSKIFNQLHKKLRDFKTSLYYDRHKGIAITTAACILVVAALMSVKIAAYSEKTNNVLSSKLIRLHVVANSDSLEDQQLKRMVRDKILDYMDGVLVNSKNIQQTRWYLTENIDEIIRLAGQEIKENGKDYDVDARLGRFPFPTKKYGDIILPSGYYQALKVVIGEGEGANWWCVLFPPLCFVDASHGTVPESVKEDLQDTLTEEEYKIIVEPERKGNIPIRIKFRVVEFFQSTKLKFTAFISKIFKPE